jgi:hypothetical protein
MLARYCAKADGKVEITYKKERKEVGVVGKINSSSETRQFSTMVHKPDLGVPQLELLEKHKDMLEALDAFVKARDDKMVRHQKVTAPFSKQGEVSVNDNEESRLGEDIEFADKSIQATTEEEIKYETAQMSLTEMLFFAQEQLKAESVVKNKMDEKSQVDPSGFQLTTENPPSKSTSAAPKSTSHTKKSSITGNQMNQDLTSIDNEESCTLSNKLTATNPESSNKTKD